MCVYHSFRKQIIQRLINLIRLDDDDENIRVRFTIRGILAPFDYHVKTGHFAYSFGKNQVFCGRKKRSSVIAENV